MGAHLALDDYREDKTISESGEKLAALHENELQNETKIVPLQKRAK